MGLELVFVRAQVMAELWEPRKVQKYDWKKERWLVEMWAA